MGTFTYAYTIIEGNANRPTTKVLAIQFSNSAVRILSRKVFENTEALLSDAATDEYEAYPWPTASRSMSAKETLPASRPKSFKS
jgi:hypothetical protein